MSERPGVLIVSPWYRPALGGVAEVAERLRSGLLGAGVDTHLLVLDESRPLRADPQVENLWRMAIPGHAFTSLHPRAVASTFLRGPPALWRLDRFLRSKGIRTVIAVYPIGYAWAPLALRRLTGVRLIVSLHGSDVRGYDRYSARFRWLIREVLKAAAAVTVPSAELGEEVRRLAPGAAASLCHVPNAVDTGFFAPPPPGRERRDLRPTVLHISNFAPVKRTRDLVDAFARPEVPEDARLVFVGSGREFGRTRERAESLGIMDRVEFVGAQRDVRPFLWDADVLALPSEVEGSSLVLLEAMGCAVPWVATPWGAAAELGDGECGLRVPSGAPDRLARSLAELLRDPERRRAMGRRGREIAEQRYSLQNYIRRHLELLG